MHRATAPVLAVLSLLLFVGTATAGAATGQPGRGIVAGSDVQIELPASSGFSGMIEISGKTIHLRVGTRFQATDYRVPGTVSESGVKARFGNLGRIDVQFRPSKTLPVVRPPGFCSGYGAPRHYFADETQLGYFTGTILFEGEGGYVRIDASRARGEVTNYLRFNCDDRKGTVRRTSRRSISERGPGAGIDQLDLEFEGGRGAVLAATEKHGVFAAVAMRRPNADDVATFFGGSREQSGPMRIFRLAAAKAPISAFTFDHQAGTATLTPPAPFTGTATFQRNADGSTTWVGTLAVPVLGGNPVMLTGPGFHTYLAPNFED
jgi:hypothetical protein